jgi:hypothetical protein
MSAPDWIAGLDPSVIWRVVGARLFAAAEAIASLVPAPRKIRHLTPAVHRIGLRFIWPKKYILFGNWFFLELILCSACNLYHGHSKYNLSLLWKDLHDFHDNRDFYEKRGSHDKRGCHNKCGFKSGLREPMRGDVNVDCSIHHRHSGCHLS